jgi:hypothetical protein
MNKGVVVGACLALWAISSAGAGQSEGIRQIGRTVQGGTLSNAADYSLWYGCSPTAAGMVLGYYDRNGDDGEVYPNLVPGGTAEASTYPSTPGQWDYLAQSAIASPGHVADFYAGGDGAWGDDKTTSLHSFDSLADFMGTSQDSVGNANGTTTFYYWTDGEPFTYSDALDYGVWSLDGMYGVGEYIDHSGYGYTSLFTQLTDNEAGQYGFGFDDYVDAIDAGHPVMIQVEGHSMAGIGYGPSSTVVLYDSFDPGPHTMTWGGAYEGMEMWGVTYFELAGGSPRPTAVVPVPGALLLSSIGAGILAGISRRVLGPRRGANPLHS